MSEEEFAIVVHARERVVEVRYPARPTLQSFARYETAVRAAILRLGPSWSCLVDQSALVVLRPELTALIAELNAWAKTRGMVKSARVVKNAVAELQTQRIFREAGLQGAGATFATRDEAWVALTAGA